MADTTSMTKAREPGYRFSDGRCVRREEGLSPDGHPIAGRWVYRGVDRTFIDYHYSRTSLVERNGLDLQLAQRLP